MRTDFDFRNPSLFGPVVFRPSFNQGEAITAAQAWSLFFTGSREDKLLNRNPEISNFFTASLVAIGVTGILWTLAFRPF
jgi:hypothetical protein